MTEHSLQLSSPSQLYQKKRLRDLKEQAIQFLLLLAACSSVATTIAIMWVLISESVGLFQHVSPWEFLTGTEWAPLFEPPAYGILPLVCGTLVTSAVALAVAIPLGTIAALYLTEFASPQLREAVKPILELLAGIPTVVFGYFALLFVTPLLQKVIPDLPGFNMLSPGIVMGIMITPLISSISEDAMRAVPVELREGSYATGATRLQTAWKVVFPAAISGISASYILGISRAVGETMIVAIAAGLQPIMTLNPLESAATITTYIVQVSLGDTPHGTPEYQTIFAAGLTLVIITLIFNIIGYFLSRRYRERY
ncbi:MAG: phosphate ABC transporter permease subunit PstC [Leptolyngbyaceae cyanobacterium HOT.MB2.61]|nr:phosphate ABC transporter permease subunit PstC [Leptolyngbyaceae cyanobacterium HOT.MB2.61]